MNLLISGATGFVSKSILSCLGNNLNLINKLGLVSLSLDKNSFSSNLIFAKNLNLDKEFVRLDDFFDNKLQNTYDIYIHGMSDPRGSNNRFETNFINLKKSLNRLLLNDVSVHVSSESSGALGQGFRCGFLGKLHMEVFFQRLHDEFDADVISTAPMVPFEAVLKDGTITLVEKPADLPDSKEVEKYMEPMAMVTVVTPPTYVGSMMESLQSRRGVQDSMSTLDVNTTIIKYKLPWQEIVIDLYDEIKSRSSGYASFDYEEIEPEAANIVRVDMLLNGSPVDALSFVCHRTMAEQRGRDVAMRLKNVIDRQQYEVVIQAAVGAKVLAKERIAPYRKNVLVKSGKNVGGGDVTRKKKSDGPACR